MFAKLPTHPVAAVSVQQKRLYIGGRFFFLNLTFQFSPTLK